MTEPRLAKAHSRLVADEYLRLGWKLSKEFRTTGHDEPAEYLLVWPGPGPAVCIDWAEFDKRTKETPG